MKPQVTRVSAICRRCFHSYGALPPNFPHTIDNYERVPDRLRYTLKCPIDGNTSWVILSTLCSLLQNHDREPVTSRWLLATRCSCDGWNSKWPEYCCSLTPSFEWHFITQSCCIVVLQQHLLMTPLLGWRSITLELFRASCQSHLGSCLIDEPHGSGYRSFIRVRSLIPGGRGKGLWRHALRK